MPPRRKQPAAARQYDEEGLRIEALPEVELDKHPIASVCNVSMLTFSNPRLRTHSKHPKYDALGRGLPPVER